MNKRTQYRAWYGSLELTVHMIFTSTNYYRFPSKSWALHTGI